MRGTFGGQNARGLGVAGRIAAADGRERAKHFGHFCFDRQRGARLPHQLPESGNGLPPLTQNEQALEGRAVQLPEEVGRHQERRPVHREGLLQARVAFGLVRLVELIVGGGPQQAAVTFEALRVGGILQKHPGIDYVGEGISIGA